LLVVFYLSQHSLEDLPGRRIAFLIEQEKETGERGEVDGRKSRRCRRAGGI
jgi:hypothetical protein